MIRTTITAAAIATVALAAPAIADGVKAYCSLSWHDDSMPIIEGPCYFSQHQGNAYVDDFNDYKFAFPAAEQDKTYQRQNNMEFVRFTREGQYTLQVFQGGKPTAKDQAKWPLSCTINEINSTCRVEPAANSGFTVFFSHAEEPIFTFTPVGAPTTDRQAMVDGSGRRWAMSGHHSFELEEIGGYGNTITVSSP